LTKKKKKGRKKERGRPKMVMRIANKQITYLTNEEEPQRFGWGRGRKKLSKDWDRGG